MESRDLLAADGAAAVVDNAAGELGGPGELFLPGSISGVVFATQGLDGLRQFDDPGIAGVRLELLNDAGRVVAETLTDDDGRYEFAPLWPGTYAIRQEQPAGLGDGLEWVGNGGGAVSLAGDLIGDIALNAGSELTGYDFAEHRRALAANDAVLAAVVESSAWITSLTLGSEALGLRRPAVEVTGGGPDFETLPQATAPRALAPLPTVEPVIAAVEQEAVAAETAESLRAIEPTLAEPEDEFTLGEGREKAERGVRVVELPVPDDAAARDRAFERGEAEMADAAHEAGDAKPQAAEQAPPGGG